MKEQLRDKLIEVLSSIQTAVGKAGDFAVEQLPEIAQTYIAYGRVDATIGLLMWGALAVAAAFSLRLAWLRGRGPYDDMKEFEVFVELLFGVIGSICGWIGVFVYLSMALLVWFAPKVWLLKQLVVLVS